jgi:membrane associated rhomboid family serine protease
MFPVSDEPKTRLFPFVNLAIIIACVLIFVYELTLSKFDLTQFYTDYGVVPYELTAWLDNPSGWEEPATVITSAFIHGGFLHLFGNMLFLWVFGDNIEDALGHVLYLLFYVACMVGAVALQVFINSDDIVPMVGASGAVSGVMAGYFILYPTARVDVLLIFVVVPIPAVFLIGLWLAIQLFVGIASIGAAQGASEGVAVWAHIGGFATGLAIIVALRPFIRIRPIGRRYAGW